MTYNMPGVWHKLPTGEIIRKFCVLYILAKSADIRDYKRLTSLITVYFQ